MLFLMEKQTYIAFLRGINVGGNHTVPMPVLSGELARLGFEHIITLLNSGNVIFETSKQPAGELEEKMALFLVQTFGFTIPVILRTKEDIVALVRTNPFEGIELTPEKRFYVTFLGDSPENHLIVLPAVSVDDSFRMLGFANRAVCSVLDLSVNNTPKAMARLEQLFGKNITTRNWKTVVKLAGKF